MSRSLAALFLSGVLLLSACGADETDTSVTGDDLDSVVDAVGSNSDALGDVVADNSEAVEDALAGGSEAVEDAVAQNSEAVEGAIGDATAGESIDISDVQIREAVEEAVVGTFCDNVEGFRTAFDEFVAAEVGSDAEATAVDVMSQVIGEVEELTSGQLPELIDAMRTVEGTAVDFIESGGTSTGTDPAIEGAGQTVDSAREACEDLG